MASVSLTSSGIDFSDYQTPTSSGTMVAEVFGGYEEGTFTPVIAPASGSMGTSSGNGRYIRVGNLCHVTFYAAVSGGHDGAGGVVNMSGLPFTKLSPSQRTHAHAGSYQYTGTWPAVFRMEHGAANGIMWEGDELNAAEPSDFGASAEIYITCMYEV